MNQIDLLTTSFTRVIVIGAATAAVVGLCAIAAAALPASADARSGGTSITSDSDKKAHSGKRGKRAKHNAKYRRLWNKVSRRNKRWARRTAECESGRNPKAIGGGGKYRGAFQFLKSTWRTSPKSPGGDPIRYPYRTQAVVAVALKRRAGTKPWPVCG